MSSQPWWESIAQFATFAAVMIFVMAWVKRSGGRSRPGIGHGRLVQSVVLPIIGLVGFVIFGAAGVISNLYPNETVTWWTTAGFVSMALASTSLIYIYLIDRYSVSGDGLTFRSFSGKRSLVSWTEVVSVQYSQDMKWFRVEARSGVVLRLSIMLLGVPDFAAAVLQHVPATAIDPQTNEILRATAAGNPPSPWG